MMKWGKLLSHDRLRYNPKETNCEDSFSFQQEETDQFRTDYYRDGDRILFSSAFRRLHDKTQVYPLPENDHVHSRLTHSIEVASIGRSLGNHIGEQLKERLRDNHKEEELEIKQIDSLPSVMGDIVYAACLAHDIGNPPFGHSGEKAIGSFFKKLLEMRRDLPLGHRQQDELINFEGNAQGFRVITKVQDKEIGGLQLTAATIAAFCKYPRIAGADISEKFENNVATKKYGCFIDDQIQLKMVAEKVGLLPMNDVNPAEPLCFARHPLSFLVEAADNMSYLILDLEDGIRLQYVNCEEAIKKLCSVAKVCHSPSEGNRRALPRFRRLAINQLRKEVCSSFMNNYDEIINGTYKKEITKDIDSKDTLKDIEEFTRKHCYYHMDVDRMALGGTTILQGLLEEFISAVIDRKFTPKSKMEMLCRLVGLESIGSLSEYQLILAVNDYISGMTDSFAANLFRKIRGIDTSSDIR